MTPSRREVLKAASLAATAAGAAALGGCSSPDKVTPGPATVKVADVPVGGAKIIDGSNFVVAQPVAGTFVAFTRLCPHAGCKVDQVKDDTIVCSCHNSRFAAKDGAVTGGPAQRGLDKATAKVSGDTITVSA